MKISIVIPAYNEENNIAKTLEAALAQDYTDFEIIVVNNASTDRTAEIVSKFPVRLVHEPVKGLLSARERGRLEAKGELIANIDADCLPDTDWLSRGVIHFKNESTVGVSGPYDYYDGNPFFRSVSLGTQKWVYLFMSNLLQLKMIKRGAVMIGGNNILRANTIEKAGGYTTSIKFYGEDTDTANKISRHGRIVFDPELAMKTSARRFKEEGIVHLMMKYWYYFFKHILKPN